MLQQTEVPKNIDEISKGILRNFRTRYRVCSYLFRTACAWFLVGILGFVAAFFVNEENVKQLLVRFFEASEALGLGVFTIAIAVSFAIYRCPVCDAYLSPFRPDKFRCGRCDTKLRP